MHPRGGRAGRSRVLLSSRDASRRRSLQRERSSRSVYALTLMVSAGTVLCNRLHRKGGGPHARPRSVELIGAEEIAEVLDVLNTRYLSRYSRRTTRHSAPRSSRVEQEVAQAGGGPLWPGSQRRGIEWAVAGAAGAWASAPATRSSCPASRSSPASRSIVYARARPVLAEVDETLNLDPRDVEARITPRTKAIMAVHMLGNPARIDELKAIADRHGAGPDRGLRPGLRRHLPRPAGGLLSARPASSASTSTRPSPAATAAWS